MSYSIPATRPERHTPTLAEELVHMALGHPASQLMTVGGVPIRTCHHEIESEAYAVAVALVLPNKTVFNHINAGGAIDAIPAIVPLSPEARAYRTKVAGMWNTAQARARSRPS